MEVNQMHVEVHYRKGESNKKFNQIVGVVSSALSELEGNERISRIINQINRKIN